MTLYRDREEMHSSLFSIGNNVVHCRFYAMLDRRIQPISRTLILLCQLRLPRLACLMLRRDPRLQTEVAGVAQDA